MFQMGKLKQVIFNLMAAIPIFFFFLKVKWGIRRLEKGGGEDHL